MSYKRGDIIIDELPFAHIVYKRERSKRCDWCLGGTPTGGAGIAPGGAGSPLRRCTGCLSPFYCSKTCQKSDWTLHKHECTYFKRHADKQISSELLSELQWDEMRLFYRILLRWQWGEHLTELYKPLNRCYNDLMSHSSEIQADAEKLSRFQNTLKTISQLTDGAFQLPEEAEALELFGKMAINAQDILDARCRPIGAGLYLGVSKLDHSCWPTAVCMWRGAQQQVRSISSEPITFEDAYQCYIHPLLARAVRRTELQMKYYFLCQCPGCQNPRGDEAMMSGVCPEPDCRGMIPGSSDITPLPRCTNCNSHIDKDYIAAKKALEDQVNLLVADFQLAPALKLFATVSTWLHYKNLLRIWLASNILGRLAGQPDMLVLAEQCWYENILPALRHYHPPDHPAIAVALVNAGQVSLANRSYRAAADTLQAAVASFEVSRGADDPWLNTELRPVLQRCVNKLTPDILGDKTL